MQLFWRILITAAIMALLSALLLECSLPASPAGRPAGARGQSAEPTFSSTSWPGPGPYATSTPDDVVWLPLIGGG